MDDRGTRASFVVQCVRVRERFEDRDADVTRGVVGERPRAVGGPARQKRGQRNAVDVLGHQHERVVVREEPPNPNDGRMGQLGALRRFARQLFDVLGPLAGDLRHHHEDDIARRPAWTIFASKVDL
jgi:hypothetical protein